MVTILHVDDCREDRVLAREHLLSIDKELRILEVDSGQRALEELENSSVDCILCDYQMPGMDGLELLLTIRKEKSDIPFIFFTGQGSEDVAAEALRSGADDYFTKEAGFAHYMRMIKSIRNCVEANATRRAREAAEKKLRKTASEIEILYILARRVNASLDFGQVVESAIGSILEALNPDLVLIFLLDGEDLILKGLGPAGGQYSHDQTPIHKIGQCLCGSAAEQGAALYSVDIHCDKRCTWDECKQAGLRSFAALPMLSSEGVIGIIGIASAKKRDFKRTSALLETIASLVSTAARNAIEFGRLESELQLLRRQSSRIRAVTADRSWQN